MSLPKQKLLSQTIRVYDLSSEIEQPKMTKSSLFEKIRNENKIKKMVQKLLVDLEPYRNHPLENNFQIKETVTSFIRSLDKQKLLFELPFLQFFIEKGYLDTAEEFIDRTRQEDGQLLTTEVFQAMRNVWIMNSLQIFWDLPLKLTPSVYSYSLLYPYTDNFLDALNVSKSTKMEFNRRLEKVIDGEKLSPVNLHERRVFNLLETIEEQYNRKKYPDVFRSIQLIQKAQTESLRQEQLEPLETAELLRLSFQKGGSSVLADAFLVKGNLTEEQMQFSFHYGAFLQLLDDLQDASDDRMNGHQTLFSRKEGELDDEVRRLIVFIFQVNKSKQQDSETMKFMKDVIRSCTLLMIMEAIGSHPELVSKKFYQHLESFSKVRLPFYQELQSFTKELTKDFDFNQPVQSHFD